MNNYGVKSAQFPSEEDRANMAIVGLTEEISRLQSALDKANEKLSNYEKIIISFPCELVNCRSGDDIMVPKFEFLVKIMDELIDLRSQVKDSQRTWANKPICERCGRKFEFLTPLTEVSK